MNHYYVKPNKSLADIVQTVLVIEGFSEPASDGLPVFTNGMPALFCKTEKAKDDYEQVVHLNLFSKSPDEIWTANNQTTIIAYFFKPLTIPAVFNISAKQLVESPVELRMWNAQKYNAINTQLIYAGDTKRKIKVLDNLILQQLNENQSVLENIRYATEQIINNSNKEVLSSILEELGITERTFQRMFRKYVGVTPTQFRRICQFEQSFGQLQGKRFEKISEVAFDNGFADQSHFIRSFREFTQITPNDYLKKGLKNGNT